MINVDNMSVQKMSGAVNYSGKNYISIVYASIHFEKFSFHNNIKYLCHY